MANIKNNNNIKEFNIKEFFRECRNHWWWFAISLFLCGTFAAYKIITTPPQYLREATILIKETSTRRTASDLETVLGTGGLNSANSKLSNEIVAFHSPALMEDVVERGHFNVLYTREGRRYNYTLFGRNLPASVDFIEFEKECYCSIELKETAPGKYTLSDFTFGGNKLKQKPMEVAVGDTVSTPIGLLCIHDNASFRGDRDGASFKVSHLNSKKVARGFCGKLKLAMVDVKNMSDVLQLSFTDVNIERADAILATLIQIYNENWIKDRNLTAEATSRFINERLATLDRDLNDVDSDISNFKKNNLLPDVGAVSSININQSAQTDQKIHELENRLNVSQSIKKYLTSANSGQLIPLNGDIGNTSIANQVNDYNKTLLERTKLAANSSNENPIVIDLDNSLDAMRSAILASINNQISNLQDQLDATRRVARSTTERIAANPSQEKYLLSVGRQQKVKESLYLYLLQKREENELSQAFTAYNTRLITPPTGSDRPIAPDKKKILLIAILLGIALPMGLLYLIDLLNTKVRGRKDLEALSIPLLGEVPQYSTTGKRKKLKLGKRSDKSLDGVILVKQGRRNVINEAFRVLRTNIEFLGENNKVILFTSFNAGAGKTFTSSNTATSLALRGSKVIAVDCDLRHASLSQYAGNPKIGISSYLAGRETDVDSLITKNVQNSSLDILAVGAIPPNPSELLATENFVKLINLLKEKYDYVILDCPPVEIVADTQIVEKVADRSIFVIRAGLFEREMLPELERFNTEKKFKNMMLILNGSGAAGTYYGRYGYYGYYKSKAHYEYYSSED